MNASIPGVKNHLTLKVKMKTRYPDSTTIVDRVIRHIESDRIEEACYFIGHELTRNRIYLLQKLRSVLARFSGKSDYERGYLMCLRDILFSYEISTIEKFREMAKEMMEEDAD